jgi:hypothetical protein
MPSDVDPARTPRVCTCQIVDHDRGSLRPGPRRETSSIARARCRQRRSCRAPRCRSTPPARRVACRPRRPSRSVRVVARRPGTDAHDRPFLVRPPRDDPGYVRNATVEAAGLAIEIARLHVELRRQLDEVAASRARIVSAGYEERRRLERDLHDGAQQRLITIGLALRHAQHELGVSPDKVSASIDGAVTGIEVAIEELQELARGVRPAQLDEGLTPAPPGTCRTRLAARRGQGERRTLSPENQPQRSDVTAQTQATLTVRALSTVALAAGPQRASRMRRRRRSPSGEREARSSRSRRTQRGSSRTDSDSATAAETAAQECSRQAAGAVEDGHTNAASASGAP